MVENNGIELSEAEAEQYDRQIRLWGLESQKRLRASRVLLIGLRGLGAETAKNIILSGVKSVCLLDHETLKEEDTRSQFLAPSDKIGENRAEISLERSRALNPMVDISAETKPVDDLPDEFFANFDVLCATGLKQALSVRLNELARKNGAKFLCGDVWGSFGYMFADLLEHDYSEDVIQYKAVKRGQDESEKSGRETITTTVKRKTVFVPLSDALSADWTKPELRSRLRRGDPSYFVTKLLLRFRDDEDRDPDLSKADKDFEILGNYRDELVKELKLPEGFVSDAVLRSAFGTVAAASAVVGGVLGQEIVKAVSQREPPHNNMFFFNPVKCLGFVEAYGQ